MRRPPGSWSRPTAATRPCRPCCSPTGRWRQTRPWTRSRSASSAEVGSSSISGTGARYEPVSVPALVGRLVEGVPDPAGHGRSAGHAVRVGIDAAVVDDGRGLADALTKALAEQGLPVLRVRQAGFLRPRSIRLELGADDPDAAWERWYDDAGLRREVLDPLGPDGAMTWVQTLWAAAADRASRAPRRPTAPGTVVVLDGRFLLRWELADAIDLAVHLQTSAAAQTRRTADEAERQRLLPSWQRYLEETDPAGRVLSGAAPGVVVRYEDPRHPALVSVAAQPG